MKIERHKKLLEDELCSAFARINNEGSYSSYIEHWAGLLKILLDLEHKELENEELKKRIALYDCLEELIKTTERSIKEWLVI